MLSENLKLITINKLLADGKISVRTSNCCLKAKFNSVFDIIEYKDNGQDFINIRNIGRKTCLELKSIYKYYTSLTEKDLLKKDINEMPKEEDPLQRQNEIEHLIKTDVFNAIENNLIKATDILSYLNAVQTVALKEKFNKLISVYPNRIKNRLTTVGFESYFLNYLFSYADLLKINGLGKRSLNEIIDLKTKMKDELLNQINLSEEEILKINLVQQKGNIILNEFVSFFYNQNNYLPMFWILEQELLNNDNREIEILLDIFPFFQHKEQLSLDEVAKKQGITSERVRQIRNKVFHKTFDITTDKIDYKKDSDLIRYAELLQRKEDWDYVLNYLKEEECVSHDDLIIKSFLKKEQSNLSLHFALQIIAYIFRDNYSILGGFEMYGKNRNWGKSILIKKELIDVFDFKNLKEEFENILMNNKSDYFLDIRKYIEDSRNWLRFDFDKIDGVVSVTKKILLYELGLSVEDVEGYLKIPANKERILSDVLYEILQENGKPMSIEDIFQEFKKIFPSHKYKEAVQLRPYLYKNEAITHRNRNSIYTLKEWRHIKTGTIRNSILEFLINNDLPQTAEEITEEILQHFPGTNLKSVRTTMLNDPKRKFIFFGDNLFGIRNKQYPPEYKETSQQEKIKKSIEQRLTDLEIFLVENEHFPFSSSNDKDEASLNRWWSRIIKDKLSLNKNQEAEVNRIKSQYDFCEISKNIYEWNLNYNKFKLFILENRRLPSARGNEKCLYGWLRRAKNDFLNDNLSEDQRKKYIELTKLI